MIEHSQNPVPPPNGVEAPGGWREHSRPDLELRRQKAQKIIALVEKVRPVLGARILEVGTGSGVISAELAKAAGPTGHLVSVDTMDTRLDADGYEFHLTTGVELGFDDETFDVVVSNHVVEHVGDRAAQTTHIRELVRLLRPGGVVYFATPNRWALREPHFKVPFLSWVPRRWRDGYVRLAKAGTQYDVDPFGPREVIQKLDGMALDFDDHTLNALEEYARIERPGGLRGVVARAPKSLHRLLRPAMPTMVFLIRPS